MLEQLLPLLLPMLKSRRSLALENTSLRHQLDVLHRNAKRLSLNPNDRDSIYGQQVYNNLKMVGTK